MCRGSELQPMKQKEVRLSGRQVHGYCRNKLSLPEKEDPDTHTHLCETSETVGAMGQMCLEILDRRDRGSIEHDSFKFLREISCYNQ